MSTRKIPAKEVRRHEADMRRNMQRNQQRNAQRNTQERLQKNAAGRDHRREIAKDTRRRKTKRKSVRWDKIIALITVIVIAIFAYIIYKDVSKGELAVETKAVGQIMNMYLR